MIDDDDYDGRDCDEIAEYAEGRVPKHCVTARERASWTLGYVSGFREALIYSLALRPGDIDQGFETAFRREVRKVLRETAKHDDGGERP